MANQNVEGSTDPHAETNGPHSAITRILAIHEEALLAASLMHTIDKGSGGYSDFFVDSPRNGPPFHESFGDRGPPPDNPTTWSRVRMLAVDNRIPNGGYADFFLEYPGHPRFHEVGDFSSAENTPNENDRVKIFQHSNVLKAYARLRASADQKP